MGGDAFETRKQLHQKWKAYLERIGKELLRDYPSHVHSAIIGGEERVTRLKDENQADENHGQLVGKYNLAAQISEQLDSSTDKYPLAIDALKAVSTTLRVTENRAALVERRGHFKLFAARGQNLCEQTMKKINETEGIKSAHQAGSGGGGG